MDILGLAKQFGITSEQAGDVAKMVLNNDSTKDVVANVVKKFGMDEKQAADLVDGAKGAVDGGMIDNFKLPF
jgi:uncharacterized protein with PhoU and TrkA domain